MKLSSLLSLSSTRTADPLAAGIDRFVGLEHIEPENLHIRSWGNVADGTTFTNTLKRGQVLFAKRRAHPTESDLSDFHALRQGFSPHRPTMTIVKFADIVSLITSRTADPASAGIDRFVGLEHIEPENLHIRSWGNVADGTTFTNTFKRGQVLFAKRRATLSSRVYPTSTDS